MPAFLQGPDRDGCGVRLYGLAGQGQCLGNPAAGKCQDETKPSERDRSHAGGFHEAATLVFVDVQASAGGGVKPHVGTDGWHGGGSRMGPTPHRRGIGAIVAHLQHNYQFCCR